MKTCKDCRYYEFHSKDEAMNDLGLCHRYPPNAFAANQSGMSVVNSKSWCGEYEGKGILAWFARK